MRNRSTGRLRLTAMTASVTLSVRSLALTAAATAAVVAAYTIGSASPGESTATAATPEKSADTPSILMTGTGEVTGVPDQLTFQLAVRTSAADVSTALNSSNRAARAVIRAVHAKGIALKDIQTTGLGINAMYDYSGRGRAVLTGYAASESLTVLVRSLPDAGATISAAVEAGGNAVRLHGVRLQIGDEEALLRKARTAAIEEARDKAEQYAAAAGIQLGEVTTVREVTASSPAADEYRSAGLAYATAADVGTVPIRAGSANLEVTVSVAWSLS